MDPIHPIRPRTEQPAPVAAVHPVKRVGAKQADERRRKGQDRPQPAEPVAPGEPGDHVDVRV